MKGVYDNYLITKEASQKIDIYTKIISEILGFTPQIKGLTLNYPNRHDGITRDVCLIPSDLSQILDDSDLVTSLNIDRLMIPDGIWHNHSFEGHSDKDLTLLQRIYYTFLAHKRYSKNQLIYTQRPTFLGKDKEIDIEGRTIEFKYGFLRRILEYLLNHSQYKEKGKQVIAKSLVTLQDNNEARYIGETKKPKKIKVKKVKEKNNIEVSPDKLYDQVIENSSYNGKKISEYTNSETKPRVLSKFTTRKSRRRTRRKIRSISRSLKRIEKEFDDLEKRITILEKRLKEI